MDDLRDNYLFVRCVKELALKKQLRYTANGTPRASIRQKIPEKPDFSGFYYTRRGNGYQYYRF